MELWVVWEMAIPTGLMVLEFAIQAYYRNPDPGGIATLGRLATNPGVNSSLRKSAARALASIHTKESLPYLSQLLDSPDPELQSWGVGGMAMFANQGPNSQAAGTATNPQFWKTLVG